jgi:nitrogen-specific signal transduction histidine kinase/CheY-like chemotaxis protein
VRGPLGTITHFIAIKQDITPQKQLEEQIRHVQRMEAIGTLASGIAHDLNNILAPMRLVAGLLQEKLTAPRDREMLEIVDSGAQRGAEIIRQLLTFSGGTEGERAAIQLSHLIKEMGNIMRETFPREITIAESASPGLRPVLADATQMHQVLMNLCVNARDAMPGGGVLKLEARNLSLGDGDPRLVLPAKPGDYVEVTVSDTGVGIPPEIIHRIFDPFFTTKPAGKGTGLGLSTTLGIVRSHGGIIRTESTPQKGATFFVYLPAAAAATPVRAKAAGPAGPAGPAGRGELILLVDDEPSIRETAQRILETYHYKVLTAVNGEDAMNLYLKHRGQVRLVLTDVMMPVKGGTALIRSLRALDPRLKVVATSGLDQPLQGTDLAGLGVAGILPKPFAAADMLNAIHQQLSAPG